MKRKITYILIIVVLWVIIFSFFLLSFQKKEKSQIKVLDVNSSFVQDLYNKIVPNKNFYILEQLYKNKSLPNEYKLNVGIMNLAKKIGKENSEFLDAKDVEKSVQEILGTHTNVEHQDLRFMMNDFCGYEYNEAQNRYEAFSGCGGIPHEYFYQKLIKAEEIDNKKILTEQSFYAFIERNENANNIFIYNNYDQDKMLDYIENEDGFYYEIDEDKYILNGSFYEYVFRKESEGYIFESFNKIDS